MGDGFSQVVISPNFRSVMRAVTAAHTASTLYSEGREVVARQMLEQMQKAIGDRGIIVESVLLRPSQLQVRGTALKRPVGLPLY